MNGGKECEAADERPAPPVQVPIGWQRRAEHGGAVVYVRYVTWMDGLGDTWEVLWIVSDYLSDQQTL